MDPKNWTHPLGGGDGVKSRKESRMNRNRRKFDPDHKARVVLEMISGQKGLMQASREYGIKDTVLSRWKQEFLERAGQVFAVDSHFPLHSFTRYFALETP
jgi:transposase-like protein